MFKKIKNLNKKTNQTNGITLVALIIIIIVLIILAGITICIALGENGIFKKSKKAEEKYYDNLESLDPNSLAAHVKVGDYVEYDPQVEVSNQNLLTTTIQAGSYDGDTEDNDYMNWDTIDENGNPDENLLKSGTMGSGYKETQIFTVPKETNDIKWRVLSIEDGCVNLISEKEIGRNGQWKGTDEDSLYLQDITGYAYGPQVLDQVCSIYGQGKGAKKARSITIEDVNKLKGYNPETDDTDNEVYEWTYNGKTYKWRDTFYTYSSTEAAYSYNEEGLNTTDLNRLYQLIFESDLYKNGFKRCQILAGFTLCVCV